MRPGPLRALLFDWDGTLADSAAASFRCYSRLFEAFRIAFDHERFESTYSPNWYRTRITCWWAMPIGASIKRSGRTSARLGVTE